MSLDITTKLVIGFLLTKKEINDPLFSKWLDCPNEQDLQIHQVDNLQYSGCEEIEDTFAPKTKVSDFDPEKISHITELLKQVMSDLSIARPIKLYLCAEISG